MRTDRQWNWRKNNDPISESFLPHTTETLVVEVQAGG